MKRKCAVLQVAQEATTLTVAKTVGKCAGLGTATMSNTHARPPPYGTWPNKRMMQEPLFSISNEINEFISWQMSKCALSKKIAFTFDRAHTFIRLSALSRSRRRPASDLQRSISFIRRSCQSHWSLGIHLSCYAICLFVAGLSF